jgi:superfamily II DNA or RNA helicase
MPSKEINPTEDPRIKIQVIYKPGLMTDILVEPKDILLSLKEYFKANTREFDRDLKEWVEDRKSIVTHIDPELGHFQLPLGLVKWFLLDLTQSGALSPQDIKIIDKRNDPFTPNDIDVEFFRTLTKFKTKEKVRLRDYQFEAVQRALFSPIGIISHPTAAGKGELIVTMARILQNYGQTAVVVPSESSLTSTVKRFEEYGIPYLNYKRVRRLREVENVLVSTPKVILNDIRNGNSNLARGVKYLLTNEAHHSQAETWYSLATELPGLLRCYGFSATPKIGTARSIRLMSFRDCMVRGSHGDVVAHVKSSDISEHISVPKIFNVRYHPSYLRQKDRYEFDWSKVNWYIDTPHRLKFIAEIVNLIDVHTEMTTITFVSKIDKQGDVLYNLFPESTAAWYGGGVVKNKQDLDLDTKSIFDAINERRVRHTIVTSHAREDVNLPTLNVAILFELKDEKTIKQCVGRVVRKGSPSYVINLFDSAPKLLRSQAEQRSEHVCNEYEAEATEIAGREQLVRLIRSGFH